MSFHVLYTRSNISYAAPHKSYFSTFFPFWLYVIKQFILGNREEIYAEQQAWPQWDAKHEAWMSIFSKDCSI